MGRWNYTLVLVCVLLMVGAMAPLALAEEDGGGTTTTTVASTTTTAPPTDSSPPADETPPPDDGDPGQGEGEDPPVTVRTPPKQVRRYDVLRKLVFPVVGPTYYHSSFGGCRDNCTREHHGNDIMSRYWKGLPVVAATDGVVSKMTYDEGNAGCSIRIRDPKGWETRYYHLNNDFPGTDDIGYQCAIPGLREGDKVKAGQIIGYLGDSGNAETTPAHLHFELRMPNGYPVDPYKSLKKAERISYEWLPGDAPLATRMITADVKPGSAATTVVITSTEADQLMASETDSMWLDAPVVTIDLNDPGPANTEIKRIGSRSVVVMSDLDVRWLRDTIAESAMIVDFVPLPEFEAESIHFIPDSTEVPVIGPNPIDQFATIISGNTDEIWNSRKGAFDDFARDHQALILDSDVRGTPHIGHRSIASPGKYADRQLVWWATGDGWIGTAPDADAPARGYAYVTERMATPATLTFLGSLAETAPMPIWKSR
jgi:murein DD-endopeptidase MepM/ murein hydrolase activator NlpD